MIINYYKNLSLGMFLFMSLSKSLLPDCNYASSSPEEIDWKIENGANANYPFSIRQQDSEHTINGMIDFIWCLTSRNRSKHHVPIKIHSLLYSLRWDSGLLTNHTSTIIADTSSIVDSFQQVTKWCYNCIYTIRFTSDQKAQQQFLKVLSEVHGKTFQGSMLFKAGGVMFLHGRIIVLVPIISCSSSYIIDRVSKYLSDSGTTGVRYNCNGSFHSTWGLM